MRTKKSLPADKRKASVVSRKKSQFVDWEAFFAGIPGGKASIKYGANRNIFRQGTPSDSVFYLRLGKVKLTVTSKQGKEAIVAILGAGEFLGEGCLTGPPLRVATATALSNCALFRIEKPLMVRMLHEQPSFAEFFATHLLSRNIRYEKDLVHELFNSHEKRLAQILLLRANFGKEARAEAVAPRISQKNLAQMVGITRSRVSHFMSKFKKLGFIDYNNARLTIHRGLLSVVLHE